MVILFSQLRTHSELGLGWFYFSLWDQAFQGVHNPNKYSCSCSSVDSSFEILFQSMTKISWMYILSIIFLVRLPLFSM